MVGAMGMTGVAVVLIIIGAGLETDESLPVLPVTYPPVTFLSFFLSFATIVFSFGGHAAFPTIAHDMHDPSKFGRSVTIAYSGQICIPCLVLAEREARRSVSISPLWIMILGLLDNSIGE